MKTANADNLILMLSKVAFALLMCCQAEGLAVEPSGRDIQRLPPLANFPESPGVGGRAAGILPISFDQPHSGPSAETRQVTVDRFQLGGTTAPAGIRLQNDLTGDADFASGLLLIVDGVALKIGGYVKADLIKDFGAIDTTDSFDTSAIPTSGPERENARFHARQSRLSFDTRWLVDGEVARAFIEADFFGSAASGGDSYRLRHAYGHLGRFTAGQTWTTFTDPSAG